MDKGIDPHLDEGVRGFIASTARKEHWRVASWYDFDDLMQDGYVVYCKCRDKYRTPARGDRGAQYKSRDRDMTPKEEQRQFMAFFQRAYYNYIYSLASKHNRATELPVSQMVRPGEDEASDPWESIVSDQEGDAPLVELLASMPAELRQLVELLSSDALQALGSTRLQRRVLDSGTVRLAFQSAPPRARGEDIGEYYCRMLGLDLGWAARVSQLRILLGGHQSRVQR